MDQARPTSSSRRQSSKWTLSILLVMIMVCYLLFMLYDHTSVSYQRQQQTYYRSWVITSLAKTSLLNSLKQCAEHISGQLSQWKDELSIMEDVILDRALKHVTSTSAFERVVLNALITNTTLHVGVAGGSISARKYSYANVLTKAMQDALRVPVVLHNAAIGATDSRYYAYCFGSHLDMHELDIVLWEFAANDFIKKIGPWAQEEFTRVILNLTSQPQLIFVNFLHGQQMKQKSCVNNEKIASEPLSQYYDVPSISMPDVLCPSVKQGEYLKYVMSKSNNHPNAENHRLMGMFLVQLFKLVVHRLIEKTQSGLPYDSSMQDVFPYRDELPKPLYNDTLLFLPNCWSAMATREGPLTTLKPIDVHGWVLSSPNKDDFSNRTDIKQFWESRNKTGYITFRLDIDPYRDLNCTVSVVTSGCTSCGKVRVHFDMDETSAVVINGHWKYKVTLTKRIGLNLKPGAHTMTLTALTNKSFRLAAIATSYTLT
ncbi:uncharacterized protein LOC144440670 [Glandiceps talaboti]